MKRCPNCSQIFDDSNDFCLNDGTPLLLDSGQQGFSVYPNPVEVPTQVISRPQNVAPPVSGAVSNVLFLVIGVLATALIAIAVYALLLRDSGKAPETAIGVASEAANSSGFGPSVTPTVNPAVNAFNAPPLPPINANQTPAGNWSGELTYPSGSTFSARCSLTKSDDGQVSGQIVWTLLRTTNPNKMGMIGQSATEFVRGTYEPATRTTSVNGYSKSDAIGLIILDKYRLVVSEDGKNLAGYSYGGKARARFSLRRS